MQKNVRISGLKGFLQLHLTFANFSRFCDQVGFERLTEFEIMYIVLKNIFSEAEYREVYWAQATVFHGI